ncbi:MAG: flagellar hook-associated protein FlgK [Lachnospiraceae bacterium]|nr:flagellar hook-associated protein FlgK [Lachnospiraceae bacterium]
MSTFFGLNIAASGLRAYQASANTVANNIANVDTEGYSKQVTNMQANSALRSYTDYGTLSTGVSAVSVTQLRSEYYDSKYCQYSGYKGEYDQKLSCMSQLQTYIQDDSTTKGFSTLYATFFADLDSLHNSPSDTSIRNQVISDGKNLASYFNTVANGLQEMQKDINSQIASTVDSINSIAQKIALLNDQINDVEIAGAYANDLRDDRAKLVDQLSTLVSVETKETPIQNSNYPEMYTGATNYQVKINGLSIVDGDNYRQLECIAKDYKTNQSDVEGLYRIRWTDNQTEFLATASTSGGSLKALVELRDGNNHQNFTGKIQSVDTRTVTIVNPSITKEAALTMPPEGKITLGSKEYDYSEFTMKTAENGDVTFYFTITGNTAGLNSTIGRSASIGTTIDYKGIPYYQSQMNEFLRTITKEFNDIEQTGVDMDGNPMNAFFIATNAQGKQLGFTEQEKNVTRSGADNYYQMTAAKIGIAIESLQNRRFFATATKQDFEEGQDNQDLISDLLQLQNSKILYRGSGGEQFLEYLISDVTVDAEEAELLNENYSTILSTVNKQRTSVSGVDEDEEALDLVKFQNAYNLCSKVVQIMSEMYDRLITSTGV